jgi:hypothetical protein
MVGTTNIFQAPCADFSSPSGNDLSCFLKTKAKQTKLSTHLQVENNQREKK